MRAHEFVTDEINKQVFSPGWTDETTILNRYVLKAQATDDWNKYQKLDIDVFDPESGIPFRIAHARFRIKPGFFFQKNLEASMIYVSQEYQKRGIATAIYQYVRKLGNTIKPSRFQLPPGKDMWKSFDRTDALAESDEPTRIKLGSSDPAARAWIDRVYQLYPQTFQNNHVMPLGGSGDDQEFAMFELVPSLSRRGAVEVKWFQAYPLRQGVGSRAMQQLQQLAREDGISLTLFPWDKGQVSQSKLTKFYRGQGFSPTARGSKAMQWTPDQPSVAEGWKEKVAGGVLGAAALGGSGAGIAYSPMAYVNGQQIQMAMPTSIPDNAKLVTADDGRKIYVWKSNSIKGRSVWHYRPAEQVKEQGVAEDTSSFDYDKLSALPGKERMALFKAQPELKNLYNTEWQRRIDAELNNYAWMTPQEKAQYEKLRASELSQGLTDDNRKYSAEKYLKQLFQQKMDAKKAASMLKVHWAPLKQLESFLQGKVNNKIELSAYLVPNVESLGQVRWGSENSVGIVLDGHITIGGRGDLGSDQYKMTAGQRGQQKYVSRPGQIDPTLSMDTSKHHEVLVDNWKIKEIVLPANIPPEVDRLIQQYKIPVRRLGNPKGVAESADIQPRAAGCVIVAADTGRWCLQQRSNSVSDPGVWSTWGGGREPGENLQQCVRRELAEESGYQGLTKLELIDANQDYATFLAHVPREFVPQINHECQDWRWSDPDDLPEPLHPGLQQTLGQLTESAPQYHEIEFVCANPDFCDATDPAVQRELSQALQQIPGVTVVYQDQSDYSAGQFSLAAIYSDTSARQRIIKLARQHGVAVDIERPVSSDYANRAARGELEGQIQENFADGINPKKLEILGHLKNMPLTVFGSTATKSLRDANDFDVFLDLDANPEHKKYVKPVLNLSYRYYGWIDPFVIKDGVLYVRNDTATGWTRAKNAQAILKNIRAQGRPIDQITENFADGKNPGRKGLSKRVGIPKKASLSQLQKIASSSTGERRRMAQWQLNMRRGKAKKNK
jgi:8-oxo-dGTP pyrophosphatase MutT (NUDIX family)/GNAT superfamily N-acetyltransferase